MTAKRAYEIFYTLCGKDCGWPAQWDDAAPAAQQAFQAIVDEAGPSSGGGQGSPSSLEEGSYSNAQFMPGWVFDTIETKEGPKVKMTANVSIPFEDGTSEACRFEWWADDLKNRDGTDMSGGFRSLLAGGVTEADLQEWMRGGPLNGLDRNRGTAVIQRDPGGYLKVKYFNPPGGRLAAKAPPSKAQLVGIGQRMLATLASMKGSK